MTTAMAGRFVIVWRRVFDPASADDETILVHSEGHGCVR